MGVGRSSGCVERCGDAVRVWQTGAAEYRDAREFEVVPALTEYQLGDHAEAMRLLLTHIADQTADVETQKYRRAIAYYAEHLEPPYDK